MGLESAVITSGAIGAYGYGLARYGAGTAAGTLAFNTLTSAQLLHAISCRSTRRVLGGAQRLPRNPKLTLALTASLGVQVLANLVPGLRRLLGLAPTNAGDLLVIAAGALLPLFVNEALKPAAALDRPAESRPPGPSRSGATDDPPSAASPEASAS
jgi:Ca2+-transporting ATPase